MKNNVAYVFPGQGSQSLGMLSDLASNYSSVVDTFNTVSDALGYDLWQLIQQGPELKLNQTEYTQAAMLTADVVVYQVLMQSDFPMPSIMAGHSLGEYAALVCAGALTLSDAALLVTKRGQLMQQHVPMGQGAMAAIIGLDAEKVKQICEHASTKEEQVSPANFNDLTQIVIAGHTEAVKCAVILAESMQARLAKIIPVSVPCHCPLLLNAANDFTKALAETTFNLPKTPVISNVDLSIYSSTDQLRSLLAQQLHMPVRWVETIELMNAKGIDTIIECGPGKVLSGLIKRINRSITVVSVNDNASLSQAKQIVTI